MNYSYFLLLPELVTELMAGLIYIQTLATGSYAYENPILSLSQRLVTKEIKEKTNVSKQLCENEMQVM